MALIRVPFYFMNLLPTSLLYISILLTWGIRRMNFGDLQRSSALSQRLRRGTGGMLMTATMKAAMKIVKSAVRKAASPTVGLLIMMTRWMLRCRRWTMTSRSTVVRRKSLWHDFFIRP